MLLEQEQGIGFAEAKNRLSALTAEANRTGVPFVIQKNGMPWVEVRPLAVVQRSSSANVRIEPVRRQVDVPDLDDLFSGYNGSYTPVEDEFAAPAGKEIL